MLTLIKLGGSLITDKQVEQSFRDDVVRRIAAEIAGGLMAAPQQVIIGHGSGSFGHFAAQRHDTINGVHTPEQWRGFAEVALAAADLNAKMAHCLWDAGIPVWRIQPSASLIAHDGVAELMSLHPVTAALKSGIVPLVYGDVALDDVRGGTIISTESLFTYLAQTLNASRILLVGEVPGVLDESGSVIPLITPATFSDAKDALKGSRGTDVTGGMLTKVEDMLTLVEQKPDLTIQIIDGRQPGVVREALIAPTASVGTIISP